MNVLHDNICVSPTINGIVINEKMVESETNRTESAVSCPNFAAKIVVVAPTGAQAPMTETVKTFPRTPQRYNTPSNASGNANNRNAMQR